MTETGLDIQLHKQVLTKILLDIFKTLDGKIAFKGGTCAFLFYDLPRISLDLDFDILESLTKEDIDTLKVVLEKHGRIRNFQDKRFTTFFLLDYKPNTPNIKIEFNKRIWKNNNYKLIWFLGMEMKIADEPTIFTNKIVALTNRKQTVARDLFDVYYCLQSGMSINKKLVKERTGKDLKTYLKFLTNFMKKNFTEKNILQGLGEVLGQKQKEWVRKELIKETIAAIEKYL